MGDIGKIDNNLDIKTNIKEKDIVFLNVKESPFEIYGLYDYKNQQTFIRMPENVAKTVNEGVANLFRHTSGGRVRFSTNSKYIAIKAVMPGMKNMSHMTLVGSSGFDLYVDGKKSSYYKSFIPPQKSKNGFESIVYFEDCKNRSITINFPLYNGVESLFIGLQNNAKLGCGRKYISAKPIVYYGSSITQGGCASRPGNSYQAIISRKYNVDFVNLGFSGAAKGEETIATYISGLDMSVFVMDYDNNAPNAEHLEKTHKKFFDIIRMNNPKLPIVIITRPSPEIISDGKTRMDIIYKTYAIAKESGDKNVYFIDGKGLFSKFYRDCSTVDSGHPNDFGFVHMADLIGKTISKILYF